jgi:hypothetical protein
MAYLSDIDLATLHKKRLEEKNNYKLSWYNNNMNNNSRFFEDDDQRRSTMKREDHKVKSKVFAAPRTIKSRPSILQYNKAHQQTRALFDGANNSAFDEVADTNCYSSLDVNGNSSKHNSEIFDEGYFSSPTMSRRRSGTWP